MAQAQKYKETPEEKKARLEKIENAKIAFITEKLSLTPEQAQRFWPIYNEYNTKRYELKRKLRSLREENLNNQSNEQVKASLETRLSYRQRELDLDNEYMDRYLRVISPKQLALLYRSEREFTKLLLERLQTSSRR
ncbi:Spy/CpxP family protein refolding chaperone [Rufibacter roseus]|uniref:Spy/CpxP family protein refolding chaperone n=1 Tax=Rufibacter roseus TaxID=1567108 RepID=A0ABW2DPC9_9BACT|nr:Spy/CpxP family protein refolding chaperone [Rufibacter roseus]